MTSDEDVESIKKDVREIKDFLLGNNYNPDGAAQRLDKLEKKVEKIDLKIIVSTSIASGFLTGLGFFIKSFFK
jgi:hypothetical protein